MSRRSGGIPRHTMLTDAEAEEQGLSSGVGASFSDAFGQFSGFSDFRSAALEEKKKSIENGEDSGEPPRRPADKFVLPEDDKLLSRDPVFADQFTKHPSTVVIGSPEYAIFDLPGDIDKINEFRKQEAPYTAPRIKVVEQIGPQWQQETKSWLVMLRYHKVYYRNPFN